MKPNTIVEIGALKIGNALPLTLIPGPASSRAVSTPS
jgi:hypothetical protein